MSDCIYMSNCSSRSREFDPGTVPYFRRDCYEILSKSILLLSADAKKIVVSYKRKYVHKVLDNYLVKLAQEKVWLGELTIPT